MLLALDIGNTNIVLGVFDGKTLAHSWRLTTLRERTADEMGLLVHGLFDVSRVDRKAVSAVIMASVVPPLTSPARAMVERYIGVKAMVVEPGLETGMPILYDAPADVGADRIVNGIAAYEQFGAGGAMSPRCRRLRNGDDARCDQREGRVPGRRDLSGRDHLRRRAVPARGAPAADRRAQAVARSWAARRSARWSRACSGATSAWSKAWSGA